MPEHAELHLLLSMITPLGWLERVPTYKDQQEQLKEKDLATYGFLGYPLLQSADILLYRPMYVPVGEDQVAHVEITREIARRFNFIYGREPDFEAKAERAVKNLGAKNAALYRDLRRSYQEQGDEDALDKARALLEGNSRLTLADRERLLGYLEGTGRTILPEPRGAAHRDAQGAGPRRPQDVEVLRQHHRAARGPGRGRGEAQDHADRSGARAPHRSGRSGEVPGVGPAQALFERGDAALGRRGLPHARASAASSARSR